MKKKALLWFRQDLRLSDNLALRWAVENGYEVVAYYQHEGADEDWAIGGATKWWLHHALLDLSQQIKSYGGTLILGDPNTPASSQIESLVQQHSVEAVLWNRLYEPSAVQRDTQIKSALKQQGLHVQSFNSNILFNPTQICNKSGKPFRVFTPFWKHLRELEVECLDDSYLDDLTFTGTSERTLADYQLLPEIKWDSGFYTHWNPTRQGALERLDQFLPQKAILYASDRDRPDLDGTSQMSPYLHFGQIGPRELLHRLRASGHPTIEDGITRQLFWREFAHHLLLHFPTTPTQALYEKYQLFPWEEDPDLLRAWQTGQTGFPIVDAGMRQLWRTGWMHNRVRMIVGSFLVKHLLQPWQAGAEWFWDTLVDANLANNTLGWQWIAGSGADGAPYFRVFNPITQGQKFDTTGEYVRQWCPELAKLPQKYLHCPFDAPPLELAAAGVSLGHNYPHPVISHSDGRTKALDAFAKFKELTS